MKMGTKIVLTAAAMACLAAAPSNASAAGRHSTMEPSADAWQARAQVLLADTQQLAVELSGGNQQKVILAKWMLTRPDIIFLDEPTRGIDVGAKSEIYKIINTLAKNGTSVIFISSEMPELIGMCDRILVFREGRIAAEMNREEATQMRIISAASGTGSGG